MKAKKLNIDDFKNTPLNKKQTVTIIGGLDSSPPIDPPKPVPSSPGNGYPIV